MQGWPFRDTDGRTDAVDRMSRVAAAAVAPDAADAPVH